MLYFPSVYSTYIADEGEKYYSVSFVQNSYICNIYINTYTRTHIEN